MNSIKEENAAGDMMETLDDGVNRLLEILRLLRRDETPKQLSREEYMRIYDVCYNLCIGNKDPKASEKIYQKHSATIENYLTDEIVPSLKDLRDEEFLVQLCKRWNEHKLMNRWLFNFFRYLDKYYIKHASEPTLLDSGILKFKQIVYLTYKDDFLQFLQDLINKERNNELIDPNLLKNSIDIFVSISGSSVSRDNSSPRKNFGSKYSNPNVIDIYTQDFETSFLTNSRMFFTTKSQKWAKEMKSDEFLRLIKDTMNKEVSRCEKVFQVAAKRAWKNAHPTANDDDFNENEMGTLPKLLKLLRESILGANEDLILKKTDSGMLVMLENWKKDDLQLLFNLYKDVDKGLNPIAVIFKGYVRKTGSMIQGTTKKVDDIVKLIQKYIAHHDRYESLVSDEFSNHPQLSKAMKEAFEEFLNKERDDKMTFAELLATFLDAQLKSSKIDETQREERLSKGVKLFLYLQEQDRFAEIYRNQLSKRLLSVSSVTDDEMEKRMIAKFKAHVGSGFTSKMEGMARDLISGKQLQAKFQQYCKKNKLANTELASPGMVMLDNTEFTTDLLTIAWWPTTVKMELNYPPEMKKCLALYEAFFKDNSSEKKRLNWVDSLGTVVMKAKIGRKNLELTLTTLQAACLCLFNRQKSIHFKQVMKDLNIQLNICKKVLHSFIRVGILAKEGSDNAKKIDPEKDEFFVNDALEVKKTKFKVLMPNLEESHSVEKVSEERKASIEACVVRLMKTRKTMNHGALMTEVMGQLQFFKPDAKQVKVRIENLIEREYMRRDEDNPQEYHYVA